MKSKKLKRSFLNITTLKVAGAILIVLSAVILLWHGIANSSQSIPAMVAGVYFDGEYRVCDGPWQDIKEGEHIPATKGDVTLRGNFHMLTPDGEYIGICNVDTPIAFYLDHINVTVLEKGNDPYVVDIENPIFGSSSCGVDWTAYILTSGSEEPIEIIIHNPHKYGNETAVDEFLSNIAFWTGMDFEKDVLDRGEIRRTVGLSFSLVSLMLFGTALFSTLIHIKNSKIIWLFGAAIFFSGTYLSYSAEGVSFWRESIVSNTTILGCAMMFYMQFLSMAIVHYLKTTKKIGVFVVVSLGAIEGLCFILPVFTKVLFYDLWLYWASLQIIANLVLLYCLVREICLNKGKERWIYIGSIFPLVSFGVDVVMTGLGVWAGGFVSIHVFIAIFIVAMFVVLRIIPRSINTLAKAKELETEKIVLGAKLAESRVSTMMSQIRPHFIYNTLGSIEQLCSLDPPKAGALVHNFAKYLRGNFGELDNPKPISMSREMEHVHYYVNIESVRFPDMTFSFEMNSGDFNIPALTIQPIVENAIKHGLMKLPRGGTIRVVSYETDTDYCVTVEDDGAGFDTSVLLDERNHLGIRNIRGRLEAMVNGTLEIESTVGVGTKVLIKIPKEAEK